MAALNDQPLCEHHGKTGTAPPVIYYRFQRHDYGTFKRSRERTGVEREINGSGTGTGDPCNGPFVGSFF